MTCKDCVHYEACLDWYRGFKARPAKCEHFKDKSKFIELPCKVGDIVWYITSTWEICEAEVIGIWLNLYSNPQMWLEIKYQSKFIGEGEYKSRVDLMIDKTVFLTKELAEKALKENER